MLRQHLKFSFKRIFRQRIKNILILKPLLIQKLLQMRNIEKVFTIQKLKQSSKILIYKTICLIQYACIFFN